MSYHNETLQCELIGNSVLKLDKKTHFLKDSVRVQSCQ